VYGHLRTVDSVSPIAAPGVATSLAAFGVVYMIVFGAAMVFLLRLMARPPSLATEGPAKDKPHRSAGITPGPAQRQAVSATTDNALSRDSRHDRRHD
jgi:cytochrome d ubiquinol oxidase subunit I